VIYWVWLMIDGVKRLVYSYGADWLIFRSGSGSAEVVSEDVQSGSVQFQTIIQGCLHWVFGDDGFEYFDEVLG